MLFKSQAALDIETTLTLTLVAITSSDFDFVRNPRFISTCSVSSSTVTVIFRATTRLDVGDKIIVKNVTSTDNTVGAAGSGYNGTFEVTAVSDDKTFEFNYKIFLVMFTHLLTLRDTSSRTIDLPRFERNDLKSNFYIYRNEVISQYIEGVQDGIYHLFIAQC